MASLFSSTWQEWKKIGRELGPAWPGLHMAVGVAIAARFFHGWITSPVLNKTISEILIAVLLGLYLRNALGLGSRLEPGIKFAIQRILRLGIILLGLRLSLQDVAATGLNALLLVTLCITIALALAYAAGRVFKVPPRLAALIGVGTAICGNSAIVATAPVIEAKDEEVSFAVATITLFGLIAVLVFPLIGQAAGFTDRVFGLWAGSAVNDTSQVVAVGAAYSSAALNIATVVKLTRNTLMAPLIVLFGLFYRRGQEKKEGGKSSEASRLSFSKLVPGFVLGFLIMSLLRTVGVALGILPQSTSQPGGLIFAASFLTAVDDIAKFLILVALAGVGLNTNLASLRKIGLKPLVVGTCVAVVLACVSLGLILFTPLGG
jgi:uncharacterized integral membrane protein (TIGR00698 family)